MIREHLGDTIDIHGGGRDLIFPHHENEIAQSRCAHGGDYVRYWMHNAYLDIDGEKMSKSLGNFRTVRDLLQRYRGEVLRFALLSAHYRSPLNFSADLLEQAQATLDSFYSTLRDVQDVELDTEVHLDDEPFYRRLTTISIRPSPLLKFTRSPSSCTRRRRTKSLLKARMLAAGNCWVFCSRIPRSGCRAMSDDAITAEDIEALIESGRQAKLAKDYARADEIREDLLDQGVVLEDSREGPTGGECDSACS